MKKLKKKICSSLIMQMHFILPSSALFSQGGIICWGLNHHGQNGLNSVIDMNLAGTITSLNFISFSDTLAAIMVISSRLMDIAIYS